MGHRTQLQQLPPMVQANMVGGQPSVSRIIGSKRTGFFYMVVECTATVAVATTGTQLNEGSVASLFQFFGLNEAGTDVWLSSGMGQVKISDAVAARTRFNARFASASVVGAYTLREVLIFPFAWPLSGGEWETSFVELNPSTVTNLTATPLATFTNGVNKLALAAGGSTITISNLMIRCYQEYDDQPTGATAPVYRPQVRMLTQPVTQAVVDNPFQIDTPVTLRGMLLMQECANLGIVDDIVTGRRLLCDGPNGMLEGPQDINQTDVTDMQAYSFGGDMVPGVTSFPRRAAYFWNFQSGGRLTQMLTPNQVGPNFRLEYTGQPSVVAGAGASNLRMILMEMVRIPGITRDLDAFPLLPGS